MAPENDFYGFRRPDFPWQTHRQRVRIWVNGAECLAWCQHAPRLEDVHWQQGWNVVQVALELTPGRRLQWQLQATSHRWAEVTQPGMGAAASPESEVTEATTSNKALPITAYMAVPPQRADTRPALFVRLPEDRDPNAVRMELSSQPLLVTAASGVSDVHIQGLCFEQVACNPHQGMITPPSDGKQWTIEDCTFRESTGSGIRFTSLPGMGDLDHHVRRCQFDDNACLGIQGGAPVGGLIGIHIETSSFARNNWQHYAMGWHAAAIKLCRLRNSTIRHCTIVDNDANGIWLDWECHHNVIENNLLIRNMNTGIFLEACQYGNVIAGNYIAETRRGNFGGSGIFTHDSSQLEIRNNAMVGNDGFGFAVGNHTSRNRDEGETYPHGQYNLKNNYMTDNQAGCIRLCKDEGAQMENNICLSPPGIDPFVMQDGAGEVYEASVGKGPTYRFYTYSELPAFLREFGCESENLFLAYLHQNS